MTNRWIAKVNERRNLHFYLTEQFLEDKISNTKDLSDLNWMKIFNSQISLSNEFISKYIQHIDWKWLMRPIDESILDRHSRDVVQWNAQLYGPPRTFEFLIRHKKKINWKSVFDNPPDWFTDLHIEIFCPKVQGFKASFFDCNYRSRGCAACPYCLVIC